MTAPYGPYPKYLDPAVCVGAAEACGQCRNCALDPGWRNNTFDIDAVVAEIDRLRAGAKAPLSAAETVAALVDSTAYYDAWDHLPCEPPRCPHGQDLTWYQTVHCEDCRDPWPCDTALRVCARIWLEDAHTATPRDPSLRDRLITSITNALIADLRTKADEDFGKREADKLIAMTAASRQEMAALIADRILSDLSTVRPTFPIYYDGEQVGTGWVTPEGEPV